MSLLFALFFLKDPSDQSGHVVLRFAFSFAFSSAMTLATVLGRWSLLTFLFWRALRLLLCLVLV